MDFLDLAWICILVIYSPFTILCFSNIIRLLKFINPTNLVLFNRCNDFLKSSHLSLNYCVHMIHMFECSFLKIQQPLFGVTYFWFHHTLTSRYVGLQFWNWLTVWAHLLTHNCCLVAQTNLVLLFCSFDDFIHCIETILNLFHKSPFSFKTLFLISFQLINKTNKFLLKCFFRVLHILMSLMNFLINFSFNIG